MNLAPSTLNVDSATLYLAHLYKSHIIATLYTCNQAEFICVWESACSNIKTHTKVVKLSPTTLNTTDTTLNLEHTALNLASTWMSKCNNVAEQCFSGVVRSYLRSFRDV